MEILRWLESIRTPFLDILIGLITRFGEETLAIIVLCAIYWCISKRMAYVIGIAYFLSGLTVMGMKIIFRVDRPWVIDPAFNPVPSAIEHATGYSFPSGHTQSATALFGSLGVQMKQKSLMVFYFSIAILVAFSRIYLGVHTLLDVTVSLLISFISILIALKILAHESICKKHEIIIASGIIIYAVVAIIIGAGLYSSGQIEQAFLIDCLKAAGASIGFAVGTYIEKIYIDFSVKAKGISWQLIKFALGLTGVLVIKEGLKLIIGTGMIADTVRYFLILIWIAVLFPLIIKRFFAVKVDGKGN